jgi:hypothetical protein
MMMHFESFWYGLAAVIMIASVKLATDFTESSIPASFVKNDARLVMSKSPVSFGRPTNNTRRIVMAKMKTKKQASAFLALAMTWT